MYITSGAQAIALHLPADAQIASWVVQKQEMSSHPLQNSSRMMSYDMEYHFGLFKSAVLILFPPSSLHPLLRMALVPYIAA